VLIKMPISSFDLEIWKSVAHDYRNDPVGVPRHFQFLVKQHDLDWNDIQLLLDYLAETEKQLVLKTAQDLAEYQIRGKVEDVKDHFPLQDPHWDPNQSVPMRALAAYRNWVIKGMERAIPKTFNWSALYAIQQGPKENPIEFLD
ncbi:hypothetical protein N331_01699, partial [Merops nubicus]